MLCFERTRSESDLRKLLPLLLLPPFAFVVVLFLSWMVSDDSAAESFGAVCMAEDARESALEDTSRLGCIWCIRAMDVQDVRDKAESMVMSVLAVESIMCSTFS